MAELDDIPNALANEAKNVDDAITEFLETSESLATQFSEGDTVQTPQGLGVVSGVFTEGFDDVEASENSPTYAVALQDERVGSEFYKASQLSSGEFPEVDVENPTQDVEAMLNIMQAEGDVEALGWTHPESWRESSTPARVIALKAWADMNGQFDCDGACCMGDLKDEELCASLKDEVLGTTDWRNWGA